MTVMTLDAIKAYGKILQRDFDFDGWTFEYKLMSESEFYAMNKCTEKTYASTALDGSLKRAVVYMNADAVYR
jgi:hypothetical protein